MYEELQNRLGYHFRDIRLLTQALTTPACRMDHPENPDNQRLEFLGDAVLGLLAADAVYKAYPRDPEGVLTVRRTHAVSGMALAAVAERIGLPEFLKQNAGARPIPRGSKILADAVEAIAGAVWTDGGLDAARQLFKALNLPLGGDYDEWSENPKGYLQMLTQSLCPPRLPTYRVESMKGVSHAPTVTVCVTVEGVGEARASGASKRAAETAAAIALLEKMRSRNKRTKAER